MMNGIRDIDRVRQRVANRLGVDVGAFGSVSVCVFPHFVVPVQPYTIGWILQALGIDPKPYSAWLYYDYLVCFEDQTRSFLDVRRFVDSGRGSWIYHERDYEWVEGAPQVGTYINADCRDISKRYVGKVFRDIFGYPLDVDPTQVMGRIVRKSDINAAHDGAIVIGPLSDEEYARDRDSYVYNVPVNNVDGEFIDDLRLMWCGHVCPMLDRKRRPVEARFGHGGEVFIEPVSQHLTSDDVARISAFCVAFGLDYGELDVLKDNDSGRIYIVDVNKTPNRPLGQMDAEYAEEALTNMATEFAIGLMGRELAMSRKRRGTG